MTDKEKYEELKQACEEAFRCGSHLEDGIRKIKKPIKDEPTFENIMEVSGLGLQYSYSNRAILHYGHLTEGEYARRQLQAVADYLHRGKEMDWESQEYHYFLHYSYFNKKWNLDSRISVQYIGQVYFHTEEIANKAFSLMGEERMNNTLKR